MNNRFNNDHIKIATIFVISICIIIIFNRFSEDIFNLLYSIISVVFNILKSLKPFYIGMFVAVLINPIMKYIENKILKRFSKKISKRAIRNISVTTSYLLVFTTLYIILLSIIPETFISTSKFLSKIPENIEYLKEVSSDYFEFESFTKLTNTLSEIDKEYNINILENNEDLTSFFTSKIIELSRQLPSALDKFLLNTFNTAKGFAQLIFSFVLAFYILLDKEHLISKVKKINVSVLGVKKATFFNEVMYSAYDVFEKFFIAKVIDSLIIGALFYIIASLVNLEYVGLNSIIIAVTNMIPYFGPFIGGVPIVLISLTNGTFSGLTALILVLALQQFDGLVLGPRILSQSTGLKPITIIFSIMVGGKIAGPIGMFVAVPISAVIINTIAKIYEIRKEHKKDART